MENSLNVLLCVIRAGLWGEADTNLNLNEGVDWGKVYQLAQEQSVQGVVLQGIEWFKNQNDKPNINVNIPQILLLQWIGEVQIIEQRNKEMNAFIANLIEKLRKHDIFALLVKGQGVAQCYEKPLWRCSGDVDLFLDNENYHKAKELLITNASYVENEVVDELHIGMTIDGWVVELHGTLHSELSLNIDKQIDWIQENVFKEGRIRPWHNGDTDIFLPAPDEDVIFVFTHILQHFYKGGIGLRQICDWCRLMWTYKDSLNYGLLESRLKRAGLMSEWKVFGTLAIVHLGFPKEYMPLLNANDDLNAKLKNKAERIIEFIMISGNMGHNRDSSYMRYPYLVRKCFSMARRIGDLINHTRIFPFDSLRFFPYMMFNGVRSAMRGE